METRRFSAGKWVAFLAVFLMGLSGQVEGELSLYVDGLPASSYYSNSIELVTGEPLPELGVQYEPCLDGWHGYILSSDFHLINGQVDYSKNPYGDVSITPFNEPFGYEMMTDGFLQSGIQFTIDMYNQDDIGATLITLWDEASIFNVPVDTFHIYQGGWPGYESSNVDADAGGSYTLAPDESVTFDATASTYTLWFEDGTSSTDNVSGGRNLPYWQINGVDVAFGLMPSLSCETLMTGLGLTPGIYELTLDLTTDFGSDTAFTTIEIIPEPATGLLLAIGGAVIAIKRRIR